MKLESAKSIFAKAVISGFLIGIGGIVYLVCENKYIGGFLFSFGLFCIIQYGFALFTGKVGYIPENEPIYLREVGLTLLGNMTGTGISAMFIRLTRVGAIVHEHAVNSMATKMGDGFLSRLLLGYFCGMLMYLAVDNGKRCKTDKFDTALVFGTAVPVMVFIFCGFNHSVADCFYYFASLSSPNEILSGLLYVLTIVLGNALGGMSIPCVKKLFDKA